MNYKTLKEWDEWDLCFNYHFNADLEKKELEAVNMVGCGNDLTIKRTNTTMDIWVCPEQGPQVRQFQLNMISQTAFFWGGGPFFLQT